MRLSKKILRFLLFLLLTTAILMILIISFPTGSEDEELVVADEEEGEHHSCHIYYVIVGNQANYEMNHINSWVKKGGSSCQVQMVRTNSPTLFGEQAQRLEQQERETIDLLAPFHPVILSDYLKLLTLYYSSTSISIITDFDVQLLQRPIRWLSQDHLQGCSVLWFLENNCHDDTCSSQYDGRTAQITTWFQVSLRQQSRILRDLLNFISIRLKKLSNLDQINSLRVQEFSGSGPITMFLKQELGLDYLSMPLNSSNNATLKQDPGGVLRIPYGIDEMICLAGEAIAGNSCAYNKSPNPSCLVKHHFEGSWSWKTKKTLLQKIKAFLYL